MKIKEMVVNAIEGLEFKNVTVALFKAATGPGKATSTLYVSMLGFRMAPESADRFRWLMVLLVSLGGSGLLAAFFIAFRRIGRWSRTRALQSWTQPETDEARKSSE